MSDQLPALVPTRETSIAVGRSRIVVPALIADLGEDASWR
jgi:hypothetical protein